MEQVKYIDIERLKDKYTAAFTPGEHITLTEKLDGSNAGIAVDEDGNLVAFSRRRQLDESNTLRGFWNYVQSLDKKMIANVIGRRYIIFGEWLVKNAISYDASVMNKFYVFDIWDIVKGEYTPWSFTKLIADNLGFKTVPLFYDGKFTSWEDIYSYVGKTKMKAIPCGEGVVIKSQDRLDNKFSGTPAYVKIVSKEFSEVHSSKPQKEVDPEKLAARKAAEELAATIVTPRRIEKEIFRLIEDNIIPENWDEKSLGIIAKNLPRAVYNDCVKEEPETVSQIEDFGKICGSLTMKLAREMIK